MEWYNVENVFSLVEIAVNIYILRACLCHIVYITTLYVTGFTKITCTRIILSFSPFLTKFVCLYNRLLQTLKTNMVKVVCNRCTLIKLDI